MKIYILKLGHRAHRDRRVATHCCLVSRAFGAQKIYYSGQKDSKMEGSVRKVVSNWGGPFKIQHTKSHKPLIKNFKGKVVHLTVYGLPIQTKIKEIRKHKNLLIVVGGEKVPPEVYQLADYNIAVTGQPHSEIAALSIFLHEYFQGKELVKKFKKAKLKVVPQEKGKKVLGEQARKEEG